MSCEHCVLIRSYRDQRAYLCYRAESHPILDVFRYDGPHVRYETGTSIHGGGSSLRFLQNNLGYLNSNHPLDYKSVLEEASRHGALDKRIADRVLSGEGPL
jgi:hypothetical protein